MPGTGAPGAPAGGAAARVELDRPLPANAGAIARRMRAVWPRFVSGKRYRATSVRRGEREGRRGAGGRAAGACRPASSLLRAPRGGVVASSNYEYEERKTNRCVHGTPAEALTGARPVKPAVGWYMPVGSVPGKIAPPVVRGVPFVDRVLILAGRPWSNSSCVMAASPLSPHDLPSSPHYCQLDVTLATLPYTPPCW